MLEWIMALRVVDVANIPIFTVSHLLQLPIDRSSNFQVLMNDVNFHLVRWPFFKDFCDVFPDVQFIFQVSARLRSLL